VETKAAGHEVRTFGPLALQIRLRPSGPDGGLEPNMDKASDTGQAGDVKGEVLLEGAGPSKEEEFFIEAQWRMVEKAPEIIGQAGKEAMGVVAVLSGIYMAILALKEATETLPLAWRLVALVPYPFWLAAFVCGWVAFSPRRLVLVADAPEATRDELSALAQRKHRWLQAATWLLCIGLVVALFVVVFMFIFAGEAGQ